MPIETILNDLLNDLRDLHFGPPVSHVYNPLAYAGKPYRRYFHLYGSPPKQVVFLGMNPGPWGMAQTGIPFGEVQSVKEWLKIREPVQSPPKTHPKRPVLGLSCPKREVSGKRLWGWARERYKSPDRFFSRFFVVNYCPLLFVEESGRNRTPDKLRKAEKEPLLAACDRALRRTISWLDPQWVVGVGEFARTRAVASLKNKDLIIGRITHPSPANPAANRGWAARIEKELTALGIKL